MYYGGDCGHGEQGIFKIYTAFSTDGLNFEKEGISVDVGEENGLTHAGHGRIIKLEDGTYRMYFSANFIGRNLPADILGASSMDGLNWELDENPILEMGHDPSVVEVDGKIHIYTAFLGKNMVHLVSDDGYNFELVAWMDFYQEDTRFKEFGNPEAFLLPDGDVAIYSSGLLEGETSGISGILIMKQMD